MELRQPRRRDPAACIDHAARPHTSRRGRCAGPRHGDPRRASTPDTRFRTRTAPAMPPVARRIASPCRQPLARPAPSESCRPSAPTRHRQDGAADRLPVRRRRPTTLATAGAWFGSSERPRSAGNHARSARRRPLQPHSVRVVRSEARDRTRRRARHERGWTCPQQRGAEPVELYKAAGKGGVDAHVHPLPWSARASGMCECRPADAKADRLSPCDEPVLLGSNDENARILHARDPDAHVASPTTGTFAAVDNSLPHDHRGYQHALVCLTTR